MPNLSWEKASEYYKKAANQEYSQAKIEIEKHLLSKCRKKKHFTGQPIAVKRPFILIMSESSAFLPD